VLGFCTVQAVDAQDDRTVVREALRFALHHAAGQHARGAYGQGLTGYDMWIKTLEENKANGFGLAYNAQCWSECRSMAATFLTEAKRRLNDEKLDPLFDQAIGHYTRVSRALSAVARLFPFHPDQSDAMRQRVADGKARRQAVEHLTAARQAEESGLQVLAEIATALGSTDVNAPVSAASAD